MKRIKFPLVMKDGAEARDIEALREYFDAKLVAEYFSNGKLERWLENNYYDDILEKVRKLDRSEDDFARKLSEALGVQWVDSWEIDLQAVMKQTELKEQLKPYVSEEQLQKMEHIAGSQEELEFLARSGCGRVYLFGREFHIPVWMENIECIGINFPVIWLEIRNREEFREKKIKLRDVAFAEEEMRQVAQETEAEDVFFGLLDVLDLYLDKVQQVLH